ncbi:MAG: hypothetical protein BJBARM5_0122 [Candidatus Parvarchaeum acidophilus ARMAN-5]|uniref:Uncharacterized protein n=1 Tax=Candidatus Parvarchaeum acidophilus ARMAN-5 TaxID=662762 RepID=D6GUI5_PARA5|nr:MAG: hypothetical protein BJBARM5_0122 [Candidatus Parvarchaeum acidophilus ARMAN-5]
MKKSLEGLLEPERDNKHFLYSKVNHLLSEKLDYLRPYIASLGALSHTESANLGATDFGLISGTEVK